MQLLRAALMLVLTPFLTLLISVFSLAGIMILRLDPARVQVLPRWWGRVITRGSGVSVQVEGVEKLPAGRPIIFAANHQSQFDIFALQGYLGHDFRWLAKKELFSFPVFGPAMRRAGHIEVDRAHGRQAMQSLTEAARRIADGTSVIIFPEGTRSPDGSLLPFKSGAMVLAVKAGVPIAPVAISGSHQVLPKGKLLARGGNIRIRIGDLIDSSLYTVKQKQELAELVHDRVAAMLRDESSQEITR